MKNPPQLSQTRPFTGSKTAGRGVLFTDSLKPEELASLEAAYSRLQVSTISLPQCNVKIRQNHYALFQAKEMNPDLNNIWKCQNWFRTRWIRSWWYQGRHPPPVILPDQATFDLLKLRSGRLRMISGSSFIWLRMERSYGDDDNNDNEIAVQGDFCLRVFSTRHLWTLVWVWMSSPARPQCLPGYLDSFWVEIVILMTKETLYCINLQMHQQSWSQLQLILNYSDDLRTFWKTLGKKVLFGSKTVFLWQEVHYYMVCIAYFTELNMQICDYAQKRRTCR